MGAAASEKPKGKGFIFRREWPTLVIFAKMIKMSPKKCPLSQVSHFERRNL